MDSVINKVVANDLCVGCGMCAAILPADLEIETTPLGQYVPTFKSVSQSDWQAQSLKVCPFADQASNEDTIGRDLFQPIKGIQHRKECGYYLKTFSGYLTDDKARMAATSGGIITWIAKHLLLTKQVDAVVCVGASNAEDKLFEYQYIRDVEALERCKKSRYYPVEVSSVIPQIKASQDRVLFIGLPCYIKALRLASELDQSLKDRIVFTIGLVCGHLKTKKYAAYLARHCGVGGNDIVSVDFRHKVEGRSAHKYAFAVNERTADGSVEKKIMMDRVFASSWGNNLFMLKACESCDDIFSETADITVGDAWLEEFASDHRGTSVILCRTEAMHSILNEGVHNGELALNDLDINRVIESQVGALRQRRIGLSYRLAVAEREGQWRPKKRVEPNIKAGSFLFRMTQQIRLKTARLSKEAYADQETSGQGLEVFKKRLKYPLLLSKLINVPRHLPGYCRKAFSILLGR